MAWRLQQIMETYIMDRDHKGRPSGTNKNESGTGLRRDMPPEKVKKDEEMTDKYTQGEDEISDDVHVRHPNRNTDKDDATNAGGYKQ